MKRASLAVACALLALGLGLRSARADALADARAFIGKQVALIKAGDVNGVKAGVTERLRDRVTADGLQKAQKDLAGMSVEDLVASVEAKGDAMKLKMKSGRSLTTLVKVGGEWKADTIWFR